MLNFFIMADGFNEYIKQLQEIEDAENVASLKAIRVMNEEVLSFFPSIWESINNLIISNSVPLDVIDEIKKHLTSLSHCKMQINTLSSSKKSQFYSDKISALLNQRLALTIYEAELYERELFEMVRLNEVKLVEERDFAEAKRREKEEAEQREKIEAELKAKNAKKKQPKQSIFISIQDISADEYIDVFIDGIKDSSSSKHVDHEFIGGAYWNQQIQMLKGKHRVTLLFQMARLKLELYVPEIDFTNRKGRKINALDYDIRSSSIIGKKWTSDTSILSVTVRLEDPDSWTLGEKISPEFDIFRI